MVNVASLLIGGAFTLITAILVFVLKSIYSKLDKIDSRLEEMVTEKDCNERRGTCSKGHEGNEHSINAELQEAWAQIKGHSHTGLPEGSKVIR